MFKYSSFIFLLHKNSDILDKFQYISFFFTTPPQKKTFILCFFSPYSLGEMPWKSRKVLEKCDRLVNFYNFNSKRCDYERAYRRSLAILKYFNSKRCDYEKNAAMSTILKAAISIPKGAIMSDNLLFEVGFFCLFQFQKVRL